MQMRRHVAGAPSSDSGRKLRHSVDRGRMIRGINLLAKQEAGVEVMHLNGCAGKGVDQCDLDCCQHIVAAEVSTDASTDPVEGLGGIGATIERVRC